MPRLAPVVSTLAMLGACCAPHSSAPSELASAAIVLAPPVSIEWLANGVTVKREERSLPGDGPFHWLHWVQADMGITTGFDYLFGADADGHVHVARVTHGHRGYTDEYRWLDRRGEWSADALGSAVVLDVPPGASAALSVEWNMSLQAFFAVHALRDADGLHAVVQASKRPEGGFGPPIRLFDLPANATAVEPAGSAPLDEPQIFVEARAPGAAVALWKVTFARP